ncbi:MAG TPA: hypothetical protein VIW29_21800 [Polyangiaceae bacterium]
MTRTLPFGRALLLGCVLCGAVPIACGESEENPPAPPGGAGEGGNPGGGGGGSGGGRGGSAGMAGAPEIPGISGTPQSVECGGQKCASASVTVPLQTPLYVDPCCAGAGEDACGLDTRFLALTGTSFDDQCQAKAQPGPIDESCPTPPASQIPFGSGMATLDEFPGCCRSDSGTCGVQVNKISVSGISLSTFGLGCVDAAPFFPGAAPVPCGAAGAGGDGAGGAAGGAGGESSGAAPSGGAPAGGAGAGGAP